MEKVSLTKQDRLILESYKATVTSLASYLGDSYEIVLHSLEDPTHSVIQIANGFHTGRKIGAPITDLAIYWLGKIKSGNEKINQYSYFSKNKLGEPLKSSTIAIRNSGDKIIGLLCINFYLGTPVINLISDLVQKDSSVFATENFMTSPDTVENELKTACEQVRLNPALPASQRKKEIIKILYHRGVFDIKNSVEQVANALEISINTVYFHLRNIAKEE
ncbi:MAG: PAS domain-containing protein [Lachnospiraceae bacterium]|nr:PAS domain-containing protein [Lachnospiraceae bacterium]